jgi:hypothetical protein
VREEVDHEGARRQPAGNSEMQVAAGRQAAGGRRRFTQLTRPEGLTAARERERVAGSRSRLSGADGALVGVQTRLKDEPSKDGKSVIKAHAAVYGLEVPNKDSVVECRIKLDGASMVDVELDDRKYTAAHYGHICRAQVRYDAKTKKGSVQIIDERDGGMKNETRAMLQDPARKAEAQKLLVGRSATFPADVKPGEWQTLVVEIVDDQIRVVLDGKAVGYLKSSGIAHATKTRYEFGVAGAAPGHTGQFDDLKIYSASAK